MLIASAVMCVAKRTRHKSIHVVEADAGSELPPSHMPIIRSLDEYKAGVNFPGRITLQ